MGLIVGAYIHVSKTCLSRMETLQANIDRPSIESRNWRTQMVAKFYCLESIEHLKLTCGEYPAIHTS